MITSFRGDRSLGKSQVPPTTHGFPKDLGKKIAKSKTLAYARAAFGATVNALRSAPVPWGDNVFCDPILIISYDVKCRLSLRCVYNHELERLLSPNQRLPNFEVHLAMVGLPQSQVRILHRLPKNP